MTADDLLSHTPKTFDSAIIISLTNADTSGRFEVARVVAHVFPGHSEFVKKIIMEGIEPSSEFPFGPYPDDKLRYRSNEMVEFETPGASVGLGSGPFLRKDPPPIRGVVALLGDESSLLHLSLRLPAVDAPLADAIIQQAEREAPAMDY
jgi:hypothetical protein